MTDKSPMKPPYPKYVIAPEGEIANFLTAGKQYQVVEPEGDGFRLQDDNGNMFWSFWRGSDWIRKQDWIIPTEPEEAPEWALREACKRANIDWLYFRSATCSDATGRSIRAHALTIAKHEDPPKPTQEQRERVARVMLALNMETHAKHTLAGDWDEEVPAAIQAMDAEQ